MRGLPNLVFCISFIAGFTVGNSVIGCSTPQPIAACPTLRGYTPADLAAVNAEIPVDGPATKQELKDYAGLRAQVRIACPAQP